MKIFIRDQLFKVNLPKFSTSFAQMKVFTVLVIKKIYFFENNILTVNLPDLGKIFVQFENFGVFVTTRTFFGDQI